MAGTVNQGVPQIGIADLRPDDIRLMRYRTRVVDDLTRVTYTMSETPFFNLVKQILATFEQMRTLNLSDSSRKYFESFYQVKIESMNLTWEAFLPRYLHSIKPLTYVDLTQQQPRYIYNNMVHNVMYVNDIMGGRASDQQTLFSYAILSSQGWY